MAAAVLTPVALDRYRKNGEVRKHRCLTLSVLTQREGAENSRVLLVHATSDSGGELRRRN